MSRSEALEAVAEAARPWTVNFRASEHMRLFDLGQPWFRIELYIRREGMRSIMGCGAGQIWLSRHVSTAELHRAAEAAGEALNGARDDDSLSPLALEMLKQARDAARVEDETEAKGRARLDATPAAQSPTPTPTDEELRELARSAFLARSHQGAHDVTRVSDCEAARNRALYNAGRAACVARLREMAEADGMTATGADALSLAADALESER